MKKKVLILYASYGTGHKKIAEYIASYFKKQDNELDICTLDILTYSMKRVGKWSQKTNSFLMLKMPIIHDLFYAMTYSGDNEVIRSTVDMNNAIDLYLFYELSQAADNIYDTKLKNLFVINKQADNEFGYKLLFVPWDMDQTWGNRYVEGQGNHAITSYNMAYDYELPVNWGPVPFLIQNGDETIVDEVQARYDTLRKTVWSDDNILEMLESYEDDIYTSGAYARTMVRWPDANYYDPEVELNDFKEFVLARLHWMDEYISHISM